MVQGVGFRPFVYRLACELGLKGEVYNTTGGVQIIIRCDDRVLQLFTARLQSDHPPAAWIKSIVSVAISINRYEDFQIVSSDETNAGSTEISPDIAVCQSCLYDMKTQTYRVNYPLINCTQCGPRFTILKELPYDRSKTTMSAFPMCPVCAGEYHDISDRRFHAQPIACNACGPKYYLRFNDRVIHDMEILRKEAGRLINNGNILAIKGQGGYHLMCDATQNEAVSLLRLRKSRDRKPFAVLFRSLAEVKEFCHLDENEEKILTSWRRPVVLLNEKKPLAEEVNGGLHTTGALLPYMPFHYQIFREIKAPAVVLTSGNMADNPTITDDHEAEELLGRVTPYLIGYNREIYNRTDDSVVRVIGGQVNMIRRSRGYVPSPVDLDCPVDGILAMGAELKNTFCLGKGNQAIPSQHIGDLKEWETFAFYRETIERFSQLFRFTPEMIVCDLHPDYLSTRYADELAQKYSIPLVRVQHHHAHIASCLAEYHLDEEVIGVCLDGVGYGPDGNSWGSEFLIADRQDFQRMAHFEYIPMPGGDKVINEPWRMAFSCLYHYPETRRMIKKAAQFSRKGTGDTELIREMIEKKINSPLTSGAGRLFDAVAALTGVCTTASYEAEAPMRLESLVTPGITECYPYLPGHSISFAPMFVSILKDMESNEGVSVISSKFHNTIARVISDQCNLIRSGSKLDKVVLSGGVFQNRYLLEKTISLLVSDHFRVFTNHLVPSNDGGIALGQIVIAQKRRV